MITKLKKAMVLIAILFLGGNLITFIGFTKGNDIAIIMSRPTDADSWTTSEGFILGCTYMPVIMGISLIILSIIFSTIIFLNWINENP